MATTKHSEQTVSDGIHIAYAFEYADQLSRENASNFDVGDLGKFARQLDNNSIWMLVSIDPQWVEISSNGITENNHKTLRQLIHLADGGGPFEGFSSGAFKVCLPEGSPFPQNIIWYESSAKNKKIIEKTITRNSNQIPTQISWKAFDTDGSTVLTTVTDSINYSGAVEINRTRTIS